MWKATVMTALALLGSDVLPLPAGLVLASEQHVNQTRTWNPATEGVGDLTENPPGLTPLGERKPLSTVNQFFTEREFAKYMKKTVTGTLRQPGHWRPNLIVLHNTDIPTLAMRPDGFSKQNMIALDQYYGVRQGWSAGPAAFIDQRGIWIFTGFTEPGVHSPSWNATSWGIEQLGNFDTEKYDSGDGVLVRSHTIAVLAILSIAGDIPLDNTTLRFHKEDKATTHRHCPGAACMKQGILDDVEHERQKWQSIWDAL
jgi:hypothetical protein